MENSSHDFDEKKWSSLKKDLKKTVGDTAYNNWLKHLNYISLEKNIMTGLNKANVFSISFSLSWI